MADEPQTPPVTAPAVTPPPTTPDTTPKPTSLLGDALDKAPKPDTPPAAPPAKDGKPAEPPASAAPEKYADFKLPEGFALAGETLTEASTLFKDLNLSQDQAQKLVDFHTKALGDRNTDLEKYWTDTRATWQDELKSDPKYGKLYSSGELGSSIAKMISTLEIGAATAFREAFNFTGAGDHPAIVRGIYELSKRFVEPGHVQGNAPAAVKSKPTQAEAMYPTLVKKE